MIEPEWITEDEALDIHAIQLELFGGPSGVRDPGGLQSALARPRQLLAYQTPDFADLAAAYTFGICQNHPFVDGNKRTAFVVAATFLKDHGWLVVDPLAAAPEPEVVASILLVAKGFRTEPALASWYRERMVRIRLRSR